MSESLINDSGNASGGDNDAVEELYKFGINAGINFKAYDNIPVKVTGYKKLDPINTFEAANFNPILVDNIQK